jgi:hypothetical protein
MRPRRLADIGLLGLMLALILALPLAPAPLGAQQTDAARLLAHADSAFRAGDTIAARTAYRELLRLDPSHSRATYQLAMLEAAGSAEQLRLLRRYTELEPADAWGFLALGDAWLDAGSRDDARAAYQHARALAPDDAGIAAAIAALERAPSRRRLTFEPAARAARDSDDSRLERVGASVTLAPGTRSRIGVEAGRLRVSGTAAQVDGWDAVAHAEWRPSAALLLGGRGGLVHARDPIARTSVREPVFQARARWRPVRGPSLELRARHEPMTATAELLAAPVVLTELRATAELPILGPLHARGVARHGRLRDPLDSNTRTLYGVGPVLRLSPALEVNALAARSGYARPSTAGYFAPDRVDLIDTGLYWEHEGDGPVVIALDAGVGLERIQRFAEPAGSWGRALRLWSQTSWWVSSAAAIRIEAEAYDTRAGDVVAADGSGWRWGSLTASLVIRR